MGNRNLKDKAYCLETQSQICTQCKTRKSFNEFTKNGKGFCGLRSRCKECNIQYTALWVKNNAERKKLVQKLYHEKNREKILSLRRQHYQDNKEIIKQKNRDYYQKNRERILQGRYGKTKVLS